jgi:enoyl-CoA hydratase/carnithine racemase
LATLTVSGSEFQAPPKQAIRASQRLAIEEGILYERDLFCLCFSTADKEEGVKAFLEKRPAEWQGR